MKDEQGKAFEMFRVAMDVVIRRCRGEDLAALEWFGLFPRQVIESTFESVQRGQAIMLVVEVNRTPSGQLWIDLTRKELDSTGFLWAIRVFPCLQNLGIGTRLVGAAEQILRDQGFRYAELTAEMDNLGAKRLYERLGYCVVGGAGNLNATGRWVLRKELRLAMAGGGGERVTGGTGRE